MRGVARSPTSLPARATGSLPAKDAPGFAPARSTQKAALAPGGAQSQLIRGALCRRPECPRVR